MMPHCTAPRVATLFVGLAISSVAGCHSDKPHDYGTERPPMDQLYEGDKGLQSRDVMAASDKLTSDLVTTPELNASRTQWTVVVDRVEDQTRDKQFDTNYDIFLQRMQSLISEKGQGRIQLIENRGRFNDLRSRELEGGGADRFGQGGAAG